MISIFVLLLISVVAIALVVSSGTETAMAGNYRSATSVYYAALSGLEEARGRLLPSNPDYVIKADANFLPPPGTPLNVGDRRYILNPNPALNENMGNVLTIYRDNEYASEFTATPTSTRTIASVSPNNAQGIPGPPYKWVRINAVSEQWLRQGLGQDVAPFDGNVDPTPLFYDGTNLTDVPSSGSQVLEITALAVLPNGSQKLVQYLAAPAPITLPPFFAALTLSGSQNGSDPVFQAPTINAVYAAKGDGDQDCNGNPLPPKVAIGLYGPYQGVGNSQNAVNRVIGGIPSFPPSTAAQSNYTGQDPWPDVKPLNPPFLTPSQLDAICCSLSNPQSIIQNADVILPSGPVNYPLPTVTGAALTPLGMSSSHPLTVVVNGNLDISNWNNNGFGLLLVTGTFTYDPDTDWNGIILVIGQGVVTNAQNGQFKQINGAMFVAQTRDASGNLLPNLGGASVTFNQNMQGNGIRYSSCWIQKAQPTSSYQILSFHEIAQ